MRKSGQSGKIGKREIARAFGIKGADKIELKRLLSELAADGAIEKRGKRLTKLGALPAVALVDIIGRDADGELIDVYKRQRPARARAPRRRARLRHRPP